MQIETSIPLLEKILEPWKPIIGNQYQPYKNHVYRVVNFCFLLHPSTPDDREKFIIAGCFHDIGIWANNTVDYLAPSIEVAKNYLQDQGKEQWSTEIGLMIDQHHKIRQYRDSQYPLVEIFRKADWIDVSMGIRGFNLSKNEIQTVINTFPNLGFHQNLVNLAKTELFTNQRNPLPMMKW